MTLNKTIMGAQLLQEGQELEPCFAGFALMQAAIYSRSGKNHEHVADVLADMPKVGDDETETATGCTIRSVHLFFQQMLAWRPKALFNSSLFGDVTPGTFVFFSKRHSRVHSNRILEMLLLLKYDIMKCVIHVLPAEIAERPEEFQQHLESKMRGRAAPGLGDLVMQLLNRYARHITRHFPCTSPFCVGFMS